MSDAVIALGMGPAAVVAAYESWRIGTAKKKLFAKVLSKEGGGEVDG